MTTATLALPKGRGYAVRTGLSAWSLPIVTLLPTRPSAPSAVSITVTAALESLVIRWTAPTTTVDGRPLRIGALAGYIIYWSQAPGINIHNPATFLGRQQVDSEYFTFTVPAPATYRGPFRFVVTAIDTEGTQSPPSVEITGSAADAIGTPNAVRTVNVADLAVTTPKIADAAIIGKKIASLAIGTAQVADAAITSAKIASLAVTDAHIANLNADKINAGTLTGRTIQTAATGARIMLAPVIGVDHHFLSIYDTANIRRTFLQVSTLNLYNNLGQQGVEIRAAVRGALAIFAENNVLQIELSAGLHYGMIQGPSWDRPARLNFIVGRHTRNFTDIFTGVAPTAWTTLSISAQTGAREALCLFRVEHTATTAVNYIFRPAGSTAVQHIQADFYPGAFSARASGAAGQRFNYVWVMTNTAGAFEWRADAAAPTTLQLMTFIS